ncbi:hypothetical protein [Shewanella sp. WPAGA9]|uniref:hypothetical protein n=1 Tax=Shewanella sp. ENK2 TaxID=2775245 RepID=UPI00177AFCFF|nr:hypothetical protein [Shewanella sp. WPAGA9]
MTELILDGMTVNERLFSLGLMDKFDCAIREHDREVAVSLLVKAKLTEAQASETVAVILQNSEKYGF